MLARPSTLACRVHSNSADGNRIQRRDMNTTTLIGTLATVLRAVGLVAWLVTQGPANTDQTPVTGRTAVAVPVVPVAPQSALLEVVPPLPEARPSKCGDLPRAPWNTCVALHDHEI